MRSFGVLERADEDPAADQFDKAVEATRANFSRLLGYPADLLRDARATEDDAQQRDRVGRLVRGFLHDQPDGVTRDQARILFREIGKALEDTDEGDARRTALAQMRRQYGLDSEPLEQVPDYQRFKEELSGLRLQERLARQDRTQESALSAEAAIDGAPIVEDNREPRPQADVAAMPTKVVSSNGSATS